MTVLRLGARGVEVTRLQGLLNDDLKRNPPVASDVASVAALQPKVRMLELAGFTVDIDGDFGDLTDAAVRLVQTHERIRADGAAGPMTWSRLEQQPVQPLEAEDPTANGVMVDGVIVPVPGFKVVGSHDAAWAHLSPGDCRPRRRKPDGSFVDVIQWVVHKTLADDPEVLVEGKGPPGGARRTADYWANDSAYGGAHLVFGDDGEIGALADVIRMEAFHATRSNPWSIGSEMREVYGGKFFRAALDANVSTIIVVAPKAGIQLQSHRGPYTGHPLRRMADGNSDPSPGGPDMVGIFGHRDNTERRGKWDPGEIVWGELARRVPGFEFFDFDKREDIVAWKDRQSDLVRAGHQLAITGIPLRDTVAALKLEGYIDGIWALGKAA